MTEHEAQLCREAFEFELIDNHCCFSEDLERVGQSYRDNEIQFAWECAQATWAAACRHLAGRDELADMVRAGKGETR